MRSKVERQSEEAEKAVRDIRPATRRQYSADFPRYLQFMPFAEGTAVARIVLDWILRGPLKSAGLDSPFPKMTGVAGSRTESERVMYFVEKELAHSRYFAGENF
jgi:hypothetical protein